jgi:hypothetical protein
MGAQVWEIIKFSCRREQREKLSWTAVYGNEVFIPLHEMLVENLVIWYNHERVALATDICYIKIVEKRNSVLWTGNFMRFNNREERVCRVILPTKAERGSI